MTRLSRLQHGQHVWLTLGQRSDGVAASEGTVSYCDPPGEGCVVTVDVGGRERLLVSVPREQVFFENQASSRKTRARFVSRHRRR